LDIEDNTPDVYDAVIGPLSNNLVMEALRNDAFVMQALRNDAFFMQALRNDAFVIEILSELPLLLLPVLT
jgi:hypothetical protein